MMHRPTDRRSVLLLAAGTTAAAWAGSAAAAGAGSITGTVTFEGGAPIPEGRLIVSVSDGSGVDAGAAGNEARLSGAIDSTGKETALDFAIPATARLSAATEIVARLERADGWLLARGSAAYEPGQPVDITLFTAMY